MKNKNLIKEKIDQIERLLIEIKSELEIINDVSQFQSKKIPVIENFPSDEEMRSQYEKLYNEFITKNSDVIKEFIKQKGKSYLKVFCKANNLPLDTTKLSKEKIVDVVMQWMVQRKAITKISM